MSRKKDMLATFVVHFFQHYRYNMLVNYPSCFGEIWFSFMTSKFIKSIVLAVMVFSIAPALPVYGAKAVKTGYLQDYARLGHVGGVPVEQVWVDPDFDIKNFSTLYITPVQVAPGAAQDAQSLANAKKLSKMMQAQMVSSFKTTEMFNVVAGNSFLKKGDKSVLVLQTRITIIDNGKGWVRNLIGFGAGATTVQLEGKVFDARYKRTYMEFADRRVNPGNRFFGGKKSTCDAEFLQGIDLKRISQALVDLFAYTKENSPTSKKPPVTRRFF